MKHFSQRFVRPIVLGALSIAILGTAAAGPVTFGTNWVVNGDAEAGTGANDAVTTVPVPSWAPQNGSTMFDALKYQSVPGGFPAFSDPIPPSPGSNFFAGGPSVPDAFGVQTFDVSPVASQIDSGGVSFTLSGYLGGFTNQDDYALFSVVFLNASQNTLATYTIVSPTALQRNDATGLFLESTGAAVPIGTRSLTFELEMVRQQGNYNDGYADNLSFIAQSVSTAPSGAPEPSTFLMLGSGLVLAGIARRKMRGKA